MKPIIILFLILTVSNCLSCKKDEKFVPRPYVVGPTKEMIINYVMIDDQLGWSKIDTGRTELVFFTFLSSTSVVDSVDSSMLSHSLSDIYRVTSSGLWKLRYLGSVPLVNPDSLKLRQRGGGIFQPQTLTLSMDHNLMGKPVFELWHEPTNSVYARYTLNKAGAKLILHFSGPSNSNFDSLPTPAITDQFNYKLKPEVLEKYLYKNT